MDDTLSQPSSTATPPLESVNIYPFLRKLFFISVTVLCLAVALFLVYHNGKSIYENGI